MDKDEEEEVSEVVVHEKGRNTVGFFSQVSWFLVVSHHLRHWQISTRPLSPTKPLKGKTSSLLNGLITNTTGRELHITGHRSRLSREEMNDLERGNSPVGSTHSALLDHVEEARNGYAAAAAAAEAAGESHGKRARSWSRTWMGRTRVEGHGGKKASKEKNEVGPTPPPTMSHTKSSSSVGSRPVTPNKNASRKKFSFSGGLTGTHAGFAAIAAPKRPEEDVERRRGEDPPRTPTKPAPTGADPSSNQHGRNSNTKLVTLSPAPVMTSSLAGPATAISSSTHSLTPPSVPKKSIPSPGTSTKGASQRSRPPSRPIPPPPPPLEDENITAAGHAGGDVAMTNSSPMTSVHDHDRLSASTNNDTDSSTTTNTTEQQATLPSGVSGMATTVTTRSQRLATESNLLETPPPLPPKLAMSTSEGSATKPRVLPPPNHRFSLTLYGSSTGYNPGSCCFLGCPTSSLTGLSQPMPTARPVSLIEHSPCPLKV